MTGIILFVAGFLSGIINSVAAGGALITFPAMLFAGLSPLTATITTNLTVLFGHLSTSLANRKDIYSIPRPYLNVLLPGFCGGVIGIYLLNSTSSSTFSSIVPWLLLFTVIVFVAQPFMHEFLRKPAHMRPILSIAILWLSIFFASIYAGYFSVGSGLVLLALLGFTRLKNIHQIIGLKNLVGLTIAFWAILLFAANGKLDWQIGIILAAGSLAGGIVGAKISHLLSARLIRVVVTAIGAIVVVAAFLRF